MIREGLHNVYVNVCVLAGMALADVLDRSDMVVHADDRFVTQMDKSLLSAIPADQLTKSNAGDLGFQLAYTGAAINFTSGTTTNKGLVATAVGAQGGACLADAAVERSGLMTTAARTQEDVGASAIFMGLVTKFLLDRSKQAKETGDIPKARRYMGGLAVLGAGMTVGAYGYEGSQNGILLLSSHLTGLLAGIAAHRYGNKHSWVNKKQETQTT
jgi:hypothetical protein